MSALTTVAWWFGQFPYMVRRMPHLELGPTYEFRLCHALPHHADALHRHWLRRQAIFLLLLTLHKLFIMQHFFNSYYYYYLWFALFFVHRKMIQPDYILWRHLGWTGGFVNTSLPHVGDFGITLPACIDRAMSPLRSAELLAPPPRDRLGGWNLVPHQARTASSIPNTLTS